MTKRRGVTDFLVAFEDIGATFFDLETDLLVVLDEQGNIARINDAFERELGRSEFSVLRLELFRLIHEDDLAAFIKSFDSSVNPPPIRLLRRDSGDVVVRLAAYRFRKTDEGLRGYLVLRKV